MRRTEEIRVWHIRQTTAGIHIARIWHAKQESCKLRSLPTDFTPRLTPHSQVPVNASGENKSVLESWIITYHAPETKLAGWYQWLGICWWRRIEIEGAHILAVVPNVHFSQDEIAAECAGDKAQYVARGKPSSGYAADLERRLRKLDWAVQDEIYDLINDRIQSSSNAFRRRDWKLVMLTKIPGGEMTDAPTGRAQHRSRSVLRKLPFCKPRIPKMPITEYRLVLRGTETKANNNGWASHNRYSRPWRDVDEKELGEVKLRRRDSQFVSDKFVNF